MKHHPDSLLSASDVAEYLGVGASTARNILRAGSFRLEIERGKRRMDSVPPVVRRYIERGVPYAFCYGERTRRMRAGDLMGWRPT